MKNYTKALKNKVVDKVSDVMAAPKVAYHQSKTRLHDKNSKFLRGYNAKQKAGHNPSNQERAQFNQLKDAYKK